MQEELHVSRAVFVVMSMLSIVYFEAEPAPVCKPHTSVPGICMIPLTKTGLQACLSLGFHQKWALFGNLMFLYSQKLWTATLSSAGCRQDRPHWLIKKM
jgi:hypothetical protein